MHHEPTNLQRALWARNALAAFTEEVFYGRHPEALVPDDRCDAIADLICDLLHYANQQRFNTEAVLRSAISNYEEELAE